MELAVVLLLLVIGAVHGGLIVAAWKSDGARRAWIKDGILHCNGPFTPEDISALQQWNELQAQYKARA